MCQTEQIGSCGALAIPSAMLGVRGSWSRQKTPYISDELELKS